MWWFLILAAWADVAPEPSRPDWGPSPVPDFPDEPDALAIAAVIVGTVVLLAAAWRRLLVAAHGEHNNTRSAPTSMR